MKKSSITIIVFETVSLFLLFIVLNQIYNLNNTLYTKSQDKFKMTQASDKLRQSSDDLTHFARTYAITNNPVFHEQYFNTLNIRNGKHPRPKMYDSIYWDLNKDIRQERHENTKKLSLKDIISKLKYTKEELEKLALSEKNSNDLVNLEIQAFKAMAKNPPDQKTAISLLHSKKYYEAKHKIMNPIDEFMIMLNERTQKDLIIINKKINFYFIIFFILLVIYIVGNFLVFRFIKQSLENIIKDKTKNLQLLNNKLEKSKLNLLTTQKAKDDFMANMSHELRTPLNAIIGFSSILCKKQIDENYLKLSKQIHSNSKSLLTLIDSILDLSKIQNSKFEINIYKFNAYNELTELCFEFNILCKNINIHFKSTLNNKLKAIFLGDFNRIKQIILNLISNATKFTPLDGEVILTCDYSNKNLIIVVSDTGIGMDIKKQDKIFEPFEQADGTTTRKYGGTGLGLSISQSLVQLMHGTIELDSVLDKGTAFKITIPLEKTDQQIEIQNNINTTYNQEKKPLNSHILVVEDNKTNQLLIKMLLEEFNISCDIADDGLIATKMYNPSNHKLILMDEHMPNMNGIQSMKILRQKYEDRCGAIITLTANAMKGDREKFLQAGMDDYLSKPINENQLYTTLKKFL